MTAISERYRTISKRYSLYCFECLELAQRTGDPKVTERMLYRAELWLELAKKARESSEDPFAEREWRLAEIDTALSQLLTAVHHGHHHRRLRAT